MVRLRNDIIGINARCRYIVYCTGLGDIPFRAGRSVHKQRYNAEPVVHAGGGQLIADADFTAEWVKAHIPQLLQDHAQLEKMHEATWRYGIRSASAQMAKEIIHLGTEHYFLTQGAQQ